MATNSGHDDFIKNMDKLEKSLAKPAAAGARAAAAISPGDICKTYAKVKPILDAILPVLEKVPFFSKIVPAVRLLMRIADTFCATA